jgi:hypothetical protein
MALNKSKSFKWLIIHTTAYSAIWLIALIPYEYLTSSFSFDGYLSFYLITFIAHTITDFFTSRLNSKLWREKKNHEFFVSIGFDQILHYVQLFLTFYYLLK